MSPGPWINAIVDGIDAYNLSLAECIASVRERQGAATVVIADFDYEFRARLPQNFLINPEIQRTLQGWDAVVFRAFHDSLLQDRQHFRQR